MLALDAEIRAPFVLQAALLIFDVPRPHRERGRPPFIWMGLAFLAGHVGKNMYQVGRLIEQGFNEAWVTGGATLVFHEFPLGYDALPPRYYPRISPCHCSITKICTGSCGIDTTGTGRSSALPHSQRGGVKVARTGGPVEDQPSWRRVCGLAGKESPEPYAQSQTCPGCRWRGSGTG